MKYRKYIRKEEEILGFSASACVPYARALEGRQTGACFDEITPYVTLHNKAFPKVLESLQNELDGFRYSFSEFHDFLKERMDHPSKYGMYIYFLSLLIIWFSFLVNLKRVSLCLLSLQKKLRLATVVSISTKLPSPLVLHLLRRTNRRKYENGLRLQINAVAY